ncbi:hypothetical protein AYI68_g1202 [Smittium mucronatum]|uniref:Uncharacterized protein n=1 Tax=Smittium mucronatum TaxID=133383 RepID=A0A1R0H679_9FUNG|nr:hypothetical protein AYI68_g1202 [Smittium mucronatum]
MQCCTVLEEGYQEIGGTGRLAQLRHILVHKSSVRRSDGSQRPKTARRKAMSINPTFVWESSFINPVRSRL